MDALVIAAVAGLVVIFLGLALFLKRSTSGEAGERNEEGGRQQGVRRPVPAPAGARPRGARQRLVRRPQTQQEDESGDEEGDLFDNIAQPEGKIGAKKLRKLQEKEERRKQREAELAEREDKKKRDALLEEQRKKEEKQREAEEAVKAEEERKRKEEEEKREYEEYLKLKEAFVVEEEGQDAQEDVDTESLLQQFIDHIKLSKVVMLEDLAAHFKLKTQEAIDRVKDLQSEGRLTGVIDDRGKFIYITKEELEAVAKFIKQRGRVSIVELAESSNRLINLNPDPSVALSSSHEETTEA